MAAKGSIAKAEIMSTILATFPNSFAFNDGKEVRINYTENGELVQIKVTLTAAKVPVEVDVPAATVTSAAAGDIDDVPFPISTPAEKVPDEPTDEEKERLTSLLKALNL